MGAFLEEYLVINIPQVSQCSSIDVLFEKEKTTKKKKKKIKVSKKKQPDHFREDFYSDNDFAEWCAPRRQDAAAGRMPPAGCCCWYTLP